MGTEGKRLKAKGKREGGELKKVMDEGRGTMDDRSSAKDPTTNNSLHTIHNKPSVYVCVRLPAQPVQWNLCCLYSIGMKSSVSYFIGVARWEARKLGTAK